MATIQQAIITAKNADPTLSGLTSTSNSAVWLLWTYIMAVALNVTESLYDIFTASVNAILATQKPHTLQWYATMAKAFQYGDALPAGSDIYSPVAAAGDASLIISYSAAVEAANQVRIKVATGAVGSLAALSGGQLTAFNTYMQAVKDAGVRVLCTSGPGDNLQLQLNIYYDALILKADGSRIDGTEPTPVMDGINAFLDALPFNGVFKLNSLIAYVEANVAGVKICEPLTVQANYGSTPYFDIIAATPNVYTPDAGYMVLDTVYFNANVTYVAY